MFKAISSIVVFVCLPVFVFGEVDVFGPVPWWVKDNADNMSSMRFRGVSVVNDQLVWVVGENGVVYERTGTVHQHTWEFHNITGASAYHLNDVCFVNAGVGWIVGEKKNEPDKYKGVVYRTLNGGGLWVDITPPPVVTCSLPTPFLKVQMIYDDGQYRGYISCGNGTVLKTLDGGANWTRTTTPWADPAHPQDSIQIWYNGLWVNPNNAQELWVVGDAYGLMSHSTNGGSNWTLSQPTAFNQTYDFPDTTYTPFGTRLATSDMHCLDANEGMIALSYGKLGRTTNGGSTWNTIQLEPPAESPIWFKDVIHDGAQWLACGNFGIVDRYTGAVTQENVNYRWGRDWYYSNFRCIDARSGNYAYVCGDSTGNVRQRYLPGVINVNAAVADSGAFWDLYITIIPSILRNFRTWYCTFKINAHIWRLQHLDPSTEPYTTYNYHLPKSTTPDRLLYFELYLNTNDYNSGSSGIQEVALVTVDPDTTFHGGWSDPSGDLDVITQDTPNDQGFSYRYYVEGQTAANWSSYVIHNLSWSNDYYWQGQASDPTIGQWFYDSTVQAGRTYTSRIFRCHTVQPWGFVEESVPPSITIADDRYPDAPVFVDTACQYDSATHTIKLVWKMDDWINNPDIAGYWVCPIPPDSSRNHYHLAHSAPISRTTCRLPVDTTWIGHNAVYYVAAMDYSGHISNWSESLAVYIGSSIALSTSAEATAFNNGCKFLRITDTDELWITYQSQGHINVAYSTDEGATWTTKRIGQGFYPAISCNSIAETPRPSVVWQFADAGIHYIYFSRYLGNDTWSDAQIIQTSANTTFGPPSFAIGICDTGHVVYAATSAGTSTVKYTKFYLFNPVPITAQDVGLGTSPSIAYMNSTGKLPIHVAWEYSTAIKYRTRTSAGWGLTETPSGSQRAKQPMLETVGNNAYVAWAEDAASGDIYWRYKVYTGPFGM